MKCHLYVNVGDSKARDTVHKEPLGLIALQSYLGKSHPDVEVGIFDNAFLQWNTNSFIRNVLSEKPEILGFSGFPGSLRSIHLALSELFRAAGNAYRPVVVLGGYISNFDVKVATPLLTHFDLIIKGEGEVPLTQLISQLKDGSVDFSRIHGAIYRDCASWTINPQVISNPGSLPNLNRTYLSMLIKHSESTGRIVVGGVSSSRGCTGFCSFCTIHQFRLGEQVSQAIRPPNLKVNDSFWIGRSANQVLNEVKEISAMGVRYVDFVDDDFISGDPSRAISILSSIKSMIDSHELDPITSWISSRAKTLVNCGYGEKILGLLKETGCGSVFLGLESGSDCQLRLFRKQTTAAENEIAFHMILAAGLRPIIGFIMFDPCSSIDTMCENVRFIDRNAMWSYLTRPTNILIAYNESRIKAHLEQKGLLEAPNDEGTIYSYRFLDANVALLALNAAKWNESEGVDAFRKMAFFKDLLMEFITFGGGHEEDVLRTYLKLKRIEWEFMKESVFSVKENERKTEKDKSHLLSSLMRKHQRRFDLVFNAFLKSNSTHKCTYENGGTTKRSLVHSRQLVA
jgi:radical SAM superfamily enzyme YgiQ (UPF0313 family)